MATEDADSPFRNLLLETPVALGESFARLVQQGPLPTEGIEVTRAVLLRLSAFYNAQQQVKTFLGKQITGAAADFFVETVVFYVKALVETHRLDMAVASELKIRRARGSMRPDISLWRGERCLACIECKTQLGWDRHGWEAQFLEREERLIREFTGAATFLVVLTGLNWPGFGDNPELGKKYFLLLSNVWPTDVNFDDLGSVIATPIEGLLAKLVDLAQLTT